MEDRKKEIILFEHLKTANFILIGNTVCAVTSFDSKKRTVTYIVQGEKEHVTMLVSRLLDLGSMLSILHEFKASTLFDLESNTTRTFTSQLLAGDEVPLDFIIGDEDGNDVNAPNPVVLQQSGGYQSLYSERDAILDAIGVDDVKKWLDDKAKSESIEVMGGEKVKVGSKVGWKTGTEYDGVVESIDFENKKVTVKCDEFMTYGGEPIGYTDIIDADRLAKL